MLTPRDIAMADFPRVWKGYDPKAVDDFLARVLSEYESLAKERDRLREELQGMSQETDRLRRQGADPRASEELQEMLRFARRTADQARAQAEKEAALILAEARQKAREIEESVRRDLADQIERVDVLKRAEARILRRLRALQQAVEEALRVAEGPAEDGLTDDLVEPGERVEEARPEPGEAAAG